MFCYTQHFPNTEKKRFEKFKSVLQIIGYKSYLNLSWKRAIFSNPFLFLHTIVHVKHTEEMLFYIYKMKNTIQL